MGFLPGPNSSYLRFLENQDEDRVIYIFGSGTDSATAMYRTMPVSAAVNLAVGIPLVYAGQEVGRGIGISNFDQRRRGVITWNTYATATLMPHYQKLAQIKKQFSCFSTQKMVRIPTSSSSVYAYTRPMAGLNGFVVVNIDGAPFTGSVTLSSVSSPPSAEGISDGVSYVATDLYNGSATSSVVFTGGVVSIPISLSAYGTAVYVLADSAKNLELPSLTGAEDNEVERLPLSFALEQNYPNPFNPATTIRYDLPQNTHVKLSIFDVLGRQVSVLVDDEMQAGRYEVAWAPQTTASGIYFYRISAGRFMHVKKMLFLK